VKNAVMYGAGNIGRGFIGALLSQAGYRVSFVDVAKPVVEALQSNGKYPVRYVSSEGNRDVWVENVTAIDGNNVDEVASAIAGCDLMATAVGARILKFIVPNIVAGLRRRWAMGGGCLNIIICENLMDANQVLEGMIKELLTPDECAVFDATVGLVEASIGRMVPVQTEQMKDGESLRVCVEEYGFLPVDKAAFKGEIPSITALVPAAPFDFYIKRKLFLHNMGHAICAYLGSFNGRKYIYQAIDDPDILYIVQNAMLDSANALSLKYGVPMNDILPHVRDLLRRFTNQALGDTCQRVGGDPARKLGREDRLVGAGKLCLEMGIHPVFTALGAAGAIYRFQAENSLEQTLSQAQQTLAQLSGLTQEDPLAQLILSLYPCFTEGLTPAQMRSHVQAIQNKYLKGIV